MGLPWARAAQLERVLIKTTVHSDRARCRAEKAFVDTGDIPPGSSVFP
jgi:hypothetical protein